jgi:hypothetical protein
MEHLTFTFYDIVQIVLMLAACYACKVYGYQQGIGDTVEFLHEKGIIDITDDAEVKPKD